MGRFAHDVASQAHCEGFRRLAMGPVIGGVLGPRRGQVFPSSPLVHGSFALLGGDGSDLGQV